VCSSDLSGLLRTSGYEIRRRKFQIRTPSGLAEAILALSGAKSDRIQLRVL
jgi:hypothetical protein